MGDFSTYRYKVEWHEKDGEYIATVDRFPSLSWLDPDPIQALKLLERVVWETRKDIGCHKTSNVPPYNKLGGCVRELDHGGPCHYGVKGKPILFEYAPGQE